MNNLVRCFSGWTIVNANGGKNGGSLGMRVVMNQIHGGKNRGCLGMRVVMNQIHGGKNEGCLGMRVVMNQIHIPIYSTHPL